MLKPSFWSNDSFPTTIEAALALISQDFKAVVDATKLRPLPNADQKVSRLDRQLVMQVVSFRDIATPLQKQFDEDADEDEEQSADGEKFQTKYLDKQLAIPERKKQNATRLAHLLLTDGASQMQAAEYKPIKIDKF